MRCPLEEHEILSITFGETAWPLVQITMQGAWTDAEFETYLDMRSRVLARRRTHVVILDARGAALPPSAQRKRQAAWLRDNDAAIKRWSRGICYVFDQPGMRFVLSGIFLISPPPVPNLVTSSMEEALVWARGRLERSPSRPEIVA